ncbi:MAG: hypothetical protein QHC65_06535 [Sphingomonas sp.]|nr:hypothetical protein [Sphingomonas sp.]
MYEIISRSALLLILWMATYRLFVGWPPRGGFSPQQERRIRALIKEQDADRIRANVRVLREED